MSLTSLKSHDPLAAYADGAILRGTQVPVPLTGTRFAVTIRGGVAAVETVRTFRNAEDRPIEVVLTIPMPVRAVPYAMEATVDGRVLKGICKPREAARATYEAAVDEGRLAVLHEEVLRGVHMISLTHLAPGAEVSVRSVWAATPTPAGSGEALLRIPLTVGDVYGRSPLSDADDLLSGAPRTTGLLTVDGAGVRLGERALDGEPVEVPLDRPVDLVIPVAAWPALSGRAADGRRVALAVAPDQVGEDAVDAAILVDASGSMASSCSPDRPLSKAEAVREGLAEALGEFRVGDRLHLFRFSDRCTEVGRIERRTEVAPLLAALGQAGGGTEIGGAIETVLALSSARDVVLVTDGKSHALDVSTLARSGRRFSVVLIGEDSLEAGVGHLAALTGGALVVARGAAVAAAVGEALSGLRSPHRVEPAIEGPLDRLAAHRDGFALEARWEEGEVEAGPIAAAVAALAASLALPRLDGERATALAAAENLVGPLTSLVLVDESGEARTGLPVTRKVALPIPATALAAAAAPRTFAPAMDRRAAEIEYARMAHPAAARPSEAPDRMPMGAPPSAPAARSGRPALLEVFRRAGSLWPPRRAGGHSAPGGEPARPDPVPVSRDWPRLGTTLWDTGCDALSRGDLAPLPPHLAARVTALAADEAVVAAARALGLEPILLVVGLLARREASTSRPAARVARAVFKRVAEREVERVAERLLGPAARCA